MIRWTDFHPRSPDDLPPEFITPGWYVVDIVGVEEKKSSTKGLRYYYWQLKPVKTHPLFRLWYATLQERHTDQLADLIEAALNWRPIGMVQFDPVTLLHRQVEVAVENRDYNYKTYSAVKEVAHV